MMTQKLTTVLPAVLNQIRPGATFMSVKQYTNNYGEISNYGIVFHVSYMNGVKKANSIISNYKPENDIEEVAKAELLASFSDTIKGYNPRYKAREAYTEVIDSEDNLVKGCKWYENGQAVMLYGFQVHKVVLVPGIYPKVNSKPLTLAKKKLRALTPLDNFRQFKIVEGRFDSICVENLTLSDQELLRELQEYDV